MNLLLFFKDVNEFVEPFIELRNEILVKYYKMLNIEENELI